MNTDKITPAQATAVAAIAVALVILGPAANHPNAGPLTEVLMWATLAAGLLGLWPATTVLGREQGEHGAQG